ncbi:MULTISPECIES: ASCH domain-containing protein [Yersinia]|uniref:ASCH domain-containing protein n=1 Tax=Yersinia TaxID=629 RepID=UPI0005E0998A|nr:MULTISPECIES: ASCH domain-containing protein [Yersinia]EKN4156710.1 ASCH domain-containing protein [Yersinia enterocolitica]EKN4181810.1 ASCH domain-containing protein [Yersinia ruckeri]EKN4828894.1 ASCH domain-containing protein [Yersinia enterocolitica]EKN4853785.1 ASCH domain-containing protein [Yersinia enterocolitica]ELM3738599.1 ASCH domain-containing protein [Yersinia ruckeri]
MKVLLSIKPEFVERILDGSKRFEFRKGVFKNSNVKSVVIYATMPIGMIVGEFDIADVIEDTPSIVWKKTQKYAGISKHFFDSYFDSRERAVAIQISNVRKYDTPMLLSSLGENISAPQSYRYLPN